MIDTDHYSTVSRSINDYRSAIASAEAARENVTPDGFFASNTRPPLRGQLVGIRDW